MPKILDLSGLACPLPVIRTKEALEGGRNRKPSSWWWTTRPPGTTSAASPRAGAAPCPWPRRVPATTSPLSRPPASPAKAASFPGPLRPPQSTVVVFASDLMGEGDPELGAILMRAFCQTMVQLEAPQKLLFYNRGVFLTLHDSPVLSELKGLEEMGVALLVCGTCLDFYKVRDRLAAGQVSNMFTILEAQMQAGRIIRP